LDLSHWRLAFCGAEPIRAETLSHFAEAFCGAGFRLQAFYPCYGLAETTLLAAGPDYRNEPRILAVNRAALAEHRVAPACGEPDAMVQRLVGCGPPVPDHHIVIVEPDTTNERADGEVGEILIQGPSVAEGYWNRGEENVRIFGAHVAGRNGQFLRTGDLGFFREGELFVTGRVKDVIVIRGSNHYPQDIEQSAEGAHPAVLPGAAFSLEDEAGERLVAVHQIDRQYRGGDYHQVIQAIRRAIVEQHELDPYAIVLIRQTSLPITSSGKVQRNLCREKYLSGELKIVHSWTNPAVNGAKKSLPNRHVDVQLHGEGIEWTRRGDFEPRGALSAGVELDRAAERIEAWLLEWLVARLSLDPADVSRDRPFAEFGVDSLTAVELSHELEEQFKVPLPPIVAWNYPTPAALARYLAEQTTGISDRGPQSTAVHLTNSLDTPTAAGDAQIASLLDEIERLSDAEAAQLLAEEKRSN
jgi:acyl carrier protein